MQNATYFLEKADHLFRLAKSIREDSLPPDEICNFIESLANEFMTKAVEDDTARDKAAKKR